MPTTRKRLSGEEARARILTTAVERLRETGPAGLTLAQLGQELGISHQAILHHFGSREGLIAAVVQRALDELAAELAGGLRVLEEPERGAEVMLQRAFEVLVDQGYGRMLAWLALAPGQSDEERQEIRRPIETFAQMAHAIRLTEHPDAEYRDTLFAVMLAAYGVLGVAVFERGSLRAAGLEGDASAAMEFRKWMAQVIVRHLHPSAEELDGTGKM